MKSIPSETKIPDAGPESAEAASVETASVEAATVAETVLRTETDDSTSSQPESPQALNSPTTESAPPASTESDEAPTTAEPSEAPASPARRTFVGVLALMVKYALLSPVLIVNYSLELFFSRRGLAAGTMLLLGLLCFSPWMRPSISRDVRPIHIPVGIWQGSEFNTDTLFDERRFRWDSIGVPLLLVAATGLCCVLIEPKLFSAFAGMLAALSIAGTAAMVLNHPQMIEAIDGEINQRNEIRQLMRRYADFSLTGKSGPRIEVRHQRRGFIDFSANPEDPTHSWFYLAWSLWLMMVSLFLSGATTPGKWTTRFGVAGAWLVLGLVLGGAATYRRTIAEFHWGRAQSFENNNRFDEAEHALNQVEAIMPDFADTQRMWRARGRLDVRRRQDSIYSLVFLAQQKGQAEGIEDLERAVRQSPDSRTLRNLLANLFFIKGRISVAAMSETGASTYWGRGYAVAPWRIDCLLSHAVSLEHAESAHPKLLESLLYPVLPRIGDRLIRADMQSIVGNAYFEAGQLKEARVHYRKSMDTFCLPRFINANAQEALLGM